MVALETLAETSTSVSTQDLYGDPSVAPGTGEGRSYSQRVTLCTTDMFVSAQHFFSGARETPPARNTPQRPSSRRDRRGSIQMQPIPQTPGHIQQKRGSPSVGRVCAVDPPRGRADSAPDGAAISAPARCFFSPLAMCQDTAPHRAAFRREYPSRLVPSNLPWR